MEEEQKINYPLTNEDCLTYLEQHIDLQEEGYERSVWF